MLEGEQSKPSKAPKNSSDVSQSASSSSAGPLRGGIRQRMAKAEAIEAVNNDEPADRPLNVPMKKKWGKGRISAKDVAEVFEAARDQGAVGVPKLSSMNHPQNLHRSLVSAFGHPAGAPEFFWSMIPLKSGKTSHPFCCRTCGSQPFSG